jgi:hypothetical protein
VTIIEVGTTPDAPSPLMPSWYSCNDWMTALIDALDLQPGVGGQVQASQLSLGSPCPGWTVRDVMNHSIGRSAADVTAPGLASIAFSEGIRERATTIRALEGLVA